MKNNVVFILSDARSGSTLLDQLLGANKDAITIGEVHWLAAYVNQDRSVYDPVHPLVCSCGKSVAECEFWREVEKSVGLPLNTLKLRLQLFSISKSESSHRKWSDRVKGHLNTVMQKNPAYYRNSFCQKLYGGPRVAADSIRLYDAIEEVSGARCIVDSSKSTFRFRSVFDQIPDRTKVILLARDYRAVVHSKMNRGRTLESAALGWKRKALQMEELTKDVSKQKIFRLTYESLCQDPKGQIERLCQFLDLEFSDEMLVRPAEGLHHLGGSPSKFDVSKSVIKLDKKYLSAFSENELQKIKNVVGESARIWGYD